MSHGRRRHHPCDTLERARQPHRGSLPEAQAACSILWVQGPRHAALLFRTDFERAAIWRLLPPPESRMIVVD
jgi:hypothetical protein